MPKATHENSNPPSAPPAGSETVMVDWDAKCQLGTCNAPAAYVDKFGILMCPDCMEEVRTYTCGILPLSTNDRGQAQPPETDSPMQR